ncbi:MAG TPA: hypothetical protein DCO77_06890 [Nitrospiraceae bacterium]|nr:hypothetical protein [Nitrospiraceae bacterium]
MNIRRKTILWIAGGIGVCIVLLLLLSLLATAIVNSGSVKDKIQTFASQQLGGDVRFREIDLSLFPRPRVAIQQLNLSFPDATSGAIEVIIVYPKVLPLLIGRLRLSNVRAHSPDFTLTIYKNKKKDKKHSSATPREVIDEYVTTLLAIVAVVKPDRITLENGRLRMALHDSSALSFHDIHGRAAFVKHDLELSMTANTPDSTFTISSILTHSSEGLRNIEVTVNSDVGQQTIDTISGLIGIPAEVTIKGPLSITRTQLKWANDSTASLKGRMAVRNGPALTVDVFMDRETFTIHSLSIHDGTSRAELSVNLSKKIVDFAFNGKVNRDTLDKFISVKRYRNGWIGGNFRARLLLDQPLKSELHGTLEGNHLIIPLSLKAPVQVDRLSLRATRNAVTLNSFELSRRGNHVSAKGTVKATGDGFLLTLAVDSNKIDLNDLKSVMGRGGKQQRTKRIPSLPELPVRGVLAFKAKKVTYDRFTMGPLHADIDMDHGDIRIDVRKAVLCGISAPGRLHLSRQALELDFTVASPNQKLDDFLICLRDTKRKITGTFNLEGHITGRVTGKEDLISSLRATGTVTVKEGVIERLPALAKILALLNVTEIFRAKFPDLRAQGFAYESAMMKATLKDGALVLDEMIVDGTTMDVTGRGTIALKDKTVNLTLLVSPLKTANYIIDKIPIVNYILSGTLITIPVMVTGDFGDPQVKIVPASAVGEGLVGITRRTLQVPFKIIAPIIPSREKEQTEE